MKRLAPRERKLISLAIEGLPNKEIAHRMKVSVGTVKVYMHGIVSSLKVSRYELILRGEVILNADAMRRLSEGSQEFEVEITGLA